MRHLFVVALAVLMTASAAAAQSLGDVARQEEARRRGLQQSGKVYTNDSLRPDPGSTPAAASPDTSATPATPPSGAATDAKKDDKKDEKDPKKDQAYWQARIKAERDALDRAKIFADALQSRINGLSTDFSARDDPYQRAQITGDRNKALAELTRVKGEIDQHTKAITDIQEEGRKAGVPAGWLR
jgi:hypothetical protein